ncbi:MAG: DUF1320 domain-containing protein [Candidatus Latescibacterota bacterium]|nr:MAG: DUF1320 domain-containing protein [Candidatus Latescibacterota bacterium]
MAYCTLTDLKEAIDERELLQLTDDANAGAIDQTRIDQMILDADSEINGYLGSRYSVPMVPVLPIIIKYSVDIAIYNLYSRRQGPPEHRETRYKNAIRFFEQVAAGKITLGANDPNPTVTAGAPLISKPETIFNRDKLDRF